MSDPKPSAAELVEVFLRMGKAGHYTRRSLLSRLVSRLMCWLDFHRMRLAPGCETAEIIECARCRWRLCVCVLCRHDARTK